jgi:hypothetical protein
MADSPNTAIGKKGCTLKEWLDKGIIKQSAYDDGIATLMRSLLEGPKQPAVGAPPSSAKLVDTGRKRSKSCRQEEGALHPSIRSRDASDESEAEDVGSEHSDAELPLRKRGRPAGTKGPRQNRPRLSEQSKADGIKADAIAAQKRSDAKVKIANSSKAKTPVYIVRTDGIFPRLIGNEYTNADGAQTAIWVEDYAGVYCCTLCNKSAAVYDPVTHRFENKMLHNSTKKHTNAVLRAMQMAEDERPLFWTEESQKYSDCLPSHEELEDGKVCLSICRVFIAEHRIQSGSSC